ncbi:MAG: hypothetical protein JKX76_15040 [Colwellia sp.]|nr:hypothetical protein [Colwellia sp.]
MITEIHQTNICTKEPTQLTVLLIVNSDKDSIQSARCFIANHFNDIEDVVICTCPVTALIKIENESLDVLLVDNDFEHLNSSYILGYMKEERQMYRDTLCLQLDNGKAPSSLKTTITLLSAHTKVVPRLIKGPKKNHLTLVK